MTFPLNHLASVDRAGAELRRGGLVALCDGDRIVGVMLAAENLSTERLAGLAASADGAIRLAMSGRRAEALGIAADATPAVIEPDIAADAEQFADLADPLQASPDLSGWRKIPTPDWVPAAIQLLKLAGLLPVALVAASHDATLPRVAASEILAYPQESAGALQRVAEADLPLAASEQCHVVAYRPTDGGAEHLALIIGAPDFAQPTLTRLHSACFTGDLLGSLRCDCGEQLQGAIAKLAAAGGGVLLYLAQEGRGIGLVNKLRAYQLQDGGLDTLDANRRLGFEDDERLYLTAVRMLNDLGISAVRLLTNNPAKLDALTRHGIHVTERVPHIFPPNQHNLRYLATKSTRSGHLF